MLDTLYCSQYKEAFKNEEIDGSLFVELDREILQKELGVTSKIHQIKIMQIIEGAKPVPARNN